MTGDDEMSEPTGHPLRRNGPVESIDLTGMGIVFDPELDMALGGFSEHRER
ncbi:MAG: hypothetical protein ACREQM_19120 [Candidatus Dormibacteraceae bacterium]